MPYIYMHIFLPLPCFEKVKEKIVTRKMRGAVIHHPKNVSGLACLSGLTGLSGLSGLSSLSGLSGLTGKTGTPQP